LKSATLALDFGGEETASPLDGQPETDAPHLLATLRGRGVLVATDGEKLLLDAPRGVLADLLPNLQRFKPALLELLSGADALPDALEASRLRLSRLEGVLGTEGAARAIFRAAYNLERTQAGFWALLGRESRHTLSVCFACLENGLDPLEGEVA